MNEHIQNQQYHRKQPIIIILAFFMIIGGASIWILNIIGVIRGPWSSIMVVIFTTLGVLLGFLQFYSQFVPGLSPLLAALPANLLRYLWKQHGQSQVLSLDVSKNKGVLLVKTKKNLRGATIHLCRGFDLVNLKSYAASNVVERRLEGRTAFVAIFHSLEPGNYTVHVNSWKREAKVTIYAGHITEIDWR